MSTIEITIAPSGQIAIEAVSFKGADCEAATKYLEQALGVVGLKTKKPEYYQRRKGHNQQRLGQ